jgi:hypothetical protein
MDRLKQFVRISQDFRGTCLASADRSTTRTTRQCFFGSMVTTFCEVIAASSILFCSYCAIARLFRVGMLVGFARNISMRRVSAAAQSCRSRRSRAFAKSSRINPSAFISCRGRVSVDCPTASVASAFAHSWRFSCRQHGFILPVRDASSRANRHEHRGVQRRAIGACRVGLQIYGRAAWLRASLRTKLPIRLPRLRK